MSLHLALVDLGRRGQGPPLVFRQIAAAARGLLNQTRDLLIVETIRSDGLASAGEAPEQRPVRRLGPPRLHWLRTSHRRYVVDEVRQILVGTGDLGLKRGWETFCSTTEAILGRGPGIGRKPGPLNEREFSSI